MKSETNKTIYSNDYFSIFKDGRMGISDGVGYIGSLEADEVKLIYEALRKLYNEND